MRKWLIWPCVAMVVMAASGATPELGKDKLRRLVKLPAVSFPAEWNFDPEKGFTLGSESDGKAAELASIRKQLKDDLSDAERYQKLGAIYGQLSEPGKAHAAQQKAIQLYRKRLESQPDDAQLLTELGQVLQAAGKKDEAESMLRRAVSLQPKSWKSSVALGRFLDATSRQELDAARASATGLSPDGVALARKRLDEAGFYFENAVSNAPGEAEVYLRRGLHRTLRSYVLDELGESASEDRTEAESLGRYFSAETLADLSRAAELNPRDYRLIGNAGMFEIYHATSRNGLRGVGDDFNWSALPDSAQKPLRLAMTRLEDLGRDPDAATAAGALEVLGIFQGPVLRDNNGCIASLRRVIALDPSRDQVWEMLSAALAHAHRFDELTEVCESRLKTRESARGHLLLAKSYEKTRQWDDAEEQVGMALKLAPNDLTANLAYAALLLRRSHNEDTLNEAGEWLTRCDKLMNEQPPRQKTRQQIIDFTLTRGIYFALTDDIDGARQWVGTVLQSDKDNQLAKDILAAIAY